MLDVAYKSGYRHAFEQFEKHAGIGAGAKKALSAIWKNRHVALPVAGATLGATIRPAADTRERVLFGSLGALAGGGLALKMVNRNIITDAARQVLGKKALRMAKLKDALGGGALLGGALGGSGYSAYKFYNQAKDWKDTVGREILKKGLTGAGTGALMGGVGGYALGRDPKSVLYGATVGGGLGMGAGLATHPDVRSALTALGGISKTSAAGYREDIHPYLRRAAGAGFGAYLGRESGDAVGKILEMDKSRSKLLGATGGAVIGGLLPQIPGILGGSYAGGILGQHAGGFLGKHIGSLASRLSDSTSEAEGREMGHAVGEVAGGLGGMIGGSYLGNRLLGRLDK